MKAVMEHAPRFGITPICRALGVPRSSVYRVKNGAQEGGKRRHRAKPERALSDQEKTEVLEMLDSERFVDSAPGEVYAALLDEGEYLCSVRTMYRVLEEHGQVRERRDQLRHPEYKKPELLATSPNQLWSWDVTKLMGPTKWTYFYLCVILDVFSRYVVGWMVSHRESAALYKRLLDETIEKQGIPPGQLTVHGDRGPTIKAKQVAQLLADLGVTKTHSRPYVSNDNPFSESQFKTMKYRPEFPKRSGSIQDALAFCRDFFAWYNTEHHHCGIAYLTPEQVHYGLAEEILQARQAVLDQAYIRHPERFVNGPPVAPKLPEAVWINPPNLPRKEVSPALILH
jgi:putative transposase